MRKKRTVSAGDHVYVRGYERVYVVWSCRKHISCVAPYALMDGPDPDDPDAVLEKVKLKDILTKQPRSPVRGLYSDGKRGVVAVSGVWQSPGGACKLCFHPVLPVYDDAKTLVLDEAEFDAAYPLRVVGVTHE